MAPPPTSDSAVSPCFHGCLAFLHRHSRHSLLPYITQICLSTVNRALTLGLLHSLSTPAPSCCSFLGTCVPVQIMCGCGKDCLILIPFRLPQISCLTLSFTCFSSDSDSCPDVGIGPLLHFPLCSKGRSSAMNTSVFPLVPLSYRVLGGSVVFPSGQALLSALSWYSACTSVSEGIYPNVSTERDVLPILLLLHHLVPPPRQWFALLCLHRTSFGLAIY